jgi:hypothetical protein
MVFLFETFYLFNIGQGNFPQIFFSSTLQYNKSNLLKKCLGKYFTSFKPVDEFLSGLFTQDFITKSDLYFLDFEVYMKSQQKAGRKLYSLVQMGNEPYSPAGRLY